MGGRRAWRTWRTAQSSARGGDWTGPGRGPDTRMSTPCLAPLSFAKPQPARAASGQCHIREPAPSVYTWPETPCGLP
eukprot:1569058-Pyramimonas_sp.AAC.1